MTANGDISQFGFVRFIGSFISRLLGELGGRDRRRLDDNVSHATAATFGSQERSQASLHQSYFDSRRAKMWLLPGITAERTGLANDAAFAGVVLLDETGAQLGIAKTFNSDQRRRSATQLPSRPARARLYGSGQYGPDQTSYAGQVAYLLRPELRLQPQSAVRFRYREPVTPSTIL